MIRSIILLLLTLSSISANANNDTLFLGGPYVNYSPPYLYSLAVDHTNESYHDALKQFSENKFINWGKNMAFTKGITQKAWWVIIKVKDTSGTAHRYLWSFYHTSCKYEYYEFDSLLKLIKQDTSSTYESFTQRPYPVRSVSFPFDISPGQTKLLLVKAQSTNTDVLYFDQDIALPEQYLEWEIGYTGLLNRYFGFFVFALLVNLLLFLFIRNKIYGWLSVYILFLLLYNINDFSFDVLIFPTWFFVKFVLIPKFTWIVGATASSLIVFNLFTVQQKYFPWWFKKSSIFIRVLGVLFLFSLLGHLLFEDHQSSILIISRFVGYIILAGAITFQIFNLIYISFKKTGPGYSFFSLQALSLFALLFISFICLQALMFLSSGPAM